MLSILNNQAHQGNRGVKPFPFGFTDKVMVDADDEVLSNWTFKILDSATAGAISFSARAMSLRMDSENATNKDVQLLRPTNGSILKNSVFTNTIKCKRTNIGTTPTIRWGFFNSSNNSSLVNSIWAVINAAGTPVLAVFDSTGTLDTGTGSGTITITNDTWLKCYSDGTTITFKGYTSLANFLSDTAAFTYTLAVSAIGGTVTCNRFGFYNRDDTGTQTETQTIYWVDSTVCDWYKI